MSSAGHPGGALLSKSPRDRPLWEEALVSNIRAMSALQKSLVLETVQHHIQERTQVGPGSPARPCGALPSAMQGPQGAGSLPEPRARTAAWLPLASAILEAPDHRDVRQKVPEGRKVLGHMLRGQVGRRRRHWSPAAGVGPGAACPQALVPAPLLCLGTPRPVGCRRLPSSGLLPLWGARPCSSLTPHMLWPSVQCEGLSHHGPRLSSQAGWVPPGPCPPHSCSRFSSASGRVGGDGSRDCACRGGRARGTHTAWLRAPGAWPMASPCSESRAGREIQPVGRVCAKALRPARW